MANEIIANWLSKSKCHAWFDIDGTVKHVDKKYPDKFNPAVVDILLSLNKIASSGACTDQSPHELASFIAKMVTNSQDIFTGPSILEGGHVVVDKGLKINQDFRVLTSPEAQEEMQLTVNMFLSGWTAIADDTDGWGLLPEVTTPVALATGKYQGVGSASIWEKGPDVHSPDYHGDYELVFEWIKAKAESLQLLKETELKEVGNGTLRIAQIGYGKAPLLEKFHDQGVVDLGACLYCGDGLNDVEPAKVIKKYGGIVIAVKNACPELKIVADVTTGGVASDGIVEIFQNIL